MRESIRKNRVDISYMDAEDGTTGLLDILHIYAREPVGASSNLNTNVWRKLESHVHETEADFSRFVESKMLSSNEVHAVLLTRLGFSTDEVQCLIDVRGNSYTNLKARTMRKLFDDGSARDFVQKIRAWKK